MRKLTIVFMVVGLGLLLSASIFAFDGPHKGGGPGPAFGSPDAKSLW
jgi:hypothetical protein